MLTLIRNGFFFKLAVSVYDIDLNLKGIIDVSFFIISLIYEILEK